MHLRSFGKHVLLTIAFSFLASGCMVGPNFRSPPKPPVHSFTEKPLPPKTASTPSAGKAGQSQRFVYGQDIPADWWIVFHSPALDCLIRRGLAHSPNITLAYATLRVAQESLSAQIGNLLYPAFGLGMTGQRQQFSGASIGTATQSIFNLFNTSVNVAYTLDVFGGSRRQIEALRAQVDYQQFQLMAAYITLSANIVTTAVTMASFQEQIKATLEMIRIQENQLDVLRNQFRLGAISFANVLTQETLLNQTRATLPALQKRWAQSRHALLVLVGDFPDRPLPDIRLNALTLPKNLPVSIASNLVRQRPDVRASEALMHAACANVGVATANLFPQFAITGNYGWEAVAPSLLFKPASKVWLISGGLTQPLFRGGMLLAQRRQAIAAYDQAASQYRQTVLTAFQNVADTLRALETDARSLRAQKQAEDSARRNLVLSQNQYRLGGVSYLNLLNAQQQYQATVIAVIQAKALRYNDTAALFQALGGGWWNKSWCVKECLNAG
jgi:NodT family efflux transporter outer membrane factor (OMF) lipoprotein